MEKIQTGVRVSPHTLQRLRTASVVHAEKMNAIIARGLRNELDRLYQKSSQKEKELFDQLLKVREIR